MTYTGKYTERLVVYVTPSMRDKVLENAEKDNRSTGYVLRELIRKKFFPEEVNKNE